ncbi:MAG: polyprenyl synthetase family protein [Candidatus Thermoplasmatota archaeon]|nr:polyprenyl synthetase family protein [Candidatus Thermoplasmatota archaeon]
MRDFLEWQLGLHGKVDEVNQRLMEAVHTDQEDLYRMSLYTIEAGGKRFRPLLTILAYEISCDQPYNKILDLAAGYELIHTASLIHDDIIDNASVRRGRPTVNSVDGLANAIVVGDYLFAKAYELGSRYGTTVSKIMADASSRLAEGQTLEAVNLGNLDLDEKTYLEIISNKTARFFEACAFGATTAAGADEKLSLSLRDFAYNLGMAFQVTDDILDIVGDATKLGKPTFTDLRHNAMTLPVIDTLRKSDENTRNRLKHALLNGGDESVDRELKDLMVQTGAIDYSFSVAKEFSGKAMNSLKNTGKSPDLHLLMELAMIVVERIEELS